MRPVSAAFATQLKVQPQNNTFYTNTTSVGQTFKVSVIAQNILSPGMYGWEFVLKWNASLINCTLEEINLGIFSAFLGPWVAVPINNVKGEYHQSVTGKAPATVVTGPFWLVNLTFVITQAPASGNTLTCNLELAAAPGYVYGLLDADANEIPHDFINGVYSFISSSAPPPPPPPPPPPAAEHDIAVAKLELNKTMIEQNYTLPINVTIANLGNNTEIFNVQVNISSTTIKVFSNVTLQKGLNTTLTLEWNSTGTAKGNYTITAYASPVTNETNTANNQLSAWVFVTIRGDINGDKIVNGEDAVKMGTSFGSRPGGEKWNNDADLNNDSYVNMKDIILLGRHFGQSWP
jgi:hypothetical protein